MRVIQRINQIIFIVKFPCTVSPLGMTLDACKVCYCQPSGNGIGFFSRLGKLEMCNYSVYTSWWLKTNHSSVISWVLLRRLFRRCLLQPPDVHWLGWLSPSPEPLSPPPFFPDVSAATHWLQSQYCQYTKMSLVLHFPVLHNHMNVISVSLPRWPMSCRLHTSYKRPVIHLYGLPMKSLASHLHWKVPHSPVSMLKVCNEILVHVQRFLFYLLGFLPSPFQHIYKKK